MSAATLAPLSRETAFGRDEIIVSKTDLKGRLAYVNRVFVRVSGYDREELLGKPHSVIRHPDMPGGVFKLLWDTIQGGQEIFAYVKNSTKDGGFYWVLAHVTPSFDAEGRIVGYHSNRRYPDREAVARVERIYRALRDVERSYSHRSEAAAASLAHLQGLLDEAGLDYESYVWRLIHGEKSGVGDD